MNRHIRSLIDMVDAAHNPWMIKSALTTFAHSCGFERFAYLQTEGAEIRTFNTYPPEWEALYLRNQYSRIDPVVTEAKRRMSMFAWTAESWPARGSGQMRAFRDHAIDYGLRSGITVPVEGGFGATIMLTFASPTAQSSGLLSLEPTKAVQAVLAIHYRLKTMGGAIARGPKRLLSPREMLCLAWSTKGKLAPDIAELTGIKQRTVQHYLDNARRKLEAATVPQLVAIAKDHDLI